MPRVKEKRTAEVPKGASCWNCYYKKEKQSLLLGECTYFLKIRQQPKEIPSNIVNEGCKHHLYPIEHKVIDVFDGEILPEKKNKYVFKSRKYKKSKNKYSKRADWD